MADLEGRTVVISGVGEGLGRETTRCALGALQETEGAVVFVSSQTQHHPPYQALQMAPGWMWGPPVEGYAKMLAGAAAITPEAQWEQMTAHMPLRRMATDGEVAESLVSFASPRTAGITGQTLLINAGEIVK